MKYKARTQSVDAGRYGVQITTGEDGSMSFTVVYLTPDRGVRTVLQATAQAEPSDDGSLLIVTDAYDATNNVTVRY